MRQQWLLKTQVKTQGLFFITLSIACLHSTITFAQTPETLSNPLEQDQRKLRANQEQLRLENNNLQLQETELELKKKILKLEQQQLGISDSTKPIGMGNIQAGTTFGTLPTVPIESKMLVFQSSGEVAETIAQEIVQVSGESDLKSIVVYSQREFAKVNGYRLYGSIRKGLVAAYKDAGIKLEPPKPGNAPTRDFGNQPSALQTSTTVLKSVAELLSYFRSEDVISPNEYTPMSQNFLVAQLVSALRKKKSTIKVYAPSIYLNNFEQFNSPIEVFLTELNELATLKSQALKQMNQIGDLQRIQRLGQLNNQADLLLNLLKEADTQIEISKSESGDARQGSQIFQLIQGAQISELLNSRDKRVLVVDLLASGGSTRTRRSLFTTIFTGQSVTYSGGVAVQYFLVNPDNSFAAGDVVYRSSGFKSMSGSVGN
jgi:hypothetical protein